MVGVSYPKPCNTWGAHHRSKILKYTKMHHCKKKFQNFSPEGPHEKVSLSPTVALDGPVYCKTGKNHHN